MYLEELSLWRLRIVAECTSNDTFHIQVDVFGLPEEQLRLVAAKIRQSPSIVNAYWHRL